MQIFCSIPCCCQNLTHPMQHRSSDKGTVLKRRLCTQLINKWEFGNWRLKTTFGEKQRMYCLTHFLWTCFKVFTSFFSVCLSWQLLCFSFSWTNWKYVSYSRGCYKMYTCNWRRFPFGLKTKNLCDFDFAHHLFTGDSIFCEESQGGCDQTTPNFCANSQLIFMHLSTSQ